MKIGSTDTSLTERKVVRRGLLAGLAGFGAALAMKVMGADKAQAADWVTGSGSFRINKNFSTQPPIIPAIAGMNGTATPVPSS